MIKRVEQRAVVMDFLVFIVGFGQLRDGEEANKALEDYWKTDEAFNGPIDGGSGSAL